MEEQVNSGSKKFLGIVIFVILIAIIVCMKLAQEDTDELDGNSVNEVANSVSNAKQITVATGGGKEGFTTDEEVKRILETKYDLDVIYDSWSNGKMIVNDLVRENGDKYDLMFCSDQRFYDYYRLPADKSNGEANRYKVLDGGLMLNTPIVIYSWDSVVNALMQQGIVVEKEGTYYITDMNRLLDLILTGTKWKDIGLDLFGTMNITSTDPVTSSPGATYYGLLLSIMCGGQVSDEGMAENLPKLKEFYKKSGYMNNTPADLFERYLKMGVGAYPMIVDYEKSLVEFANSNKDGFEQVKDQIRVLYPLPTIWNSHCIATFTEEGNEYYKAFEDKEIQQIAWERYGFRTGITGGNYDVSALGINGIPQVITSTVSSLKKSQYDQLIDYLGNN